VTAPRERIAYGTAPSCFFDLTVGPGPTIALLHGGYWRVRYDLTLMEPLVDDLVARGYTVVNVEYRRVGEDGGGAPGTFDDVQAALTLARPAAVIGHSAGGHLALWAVPRLATPPAVVALAPVPRLRLAHELDLSNDAAVQLLHGDLTALDIWSADHPRSPTLIVHGTADVDVPIAMSHDFVDRCRCNYLELGGADHFDLITPGGPAWGSVCGWLSNVIGQKRSTVPTS
jgi:acetyl esterase/lipase